MEQYKILQKDRFDEFIDKIASRQSLYAPVAKGYNRYAFEEVKTGDQISLDYIPTIIPPKKYFMPQREKIATFDISKGQNMESVFENNKKIIFGVHTCDLAGIHCLNAVFSEPPRDMRYLVRKTDISIIGYECNFYCDEFASCRLVRCDVPSGGYDLFFTNIGDKFIAHVNTLAGEEIINYAKVFDDAKKEDIRALGELRKNKRKVFKNEVPILPGKIAELFDKIYDSPVWQELNERCVACGNCTNVCPTCYCFDVFDEINLDLETGDRYRRWDSCQSETFAKVAGGASFRKERGMRQRHRYFRKFKYPMNKFSLFFCTGCGRCSRTCMASINLKEVLAALAKGAGMLSPEAGEIKA
jgi:sulfhydrogenase subunit beta (sulfur reductase)